MIHPIVSYVSSRFASCSGRLSELALLALPMSWTASADTLFVPFVYPSIAAAIFAAEPVDEILIVEGEYAPAFLNKSRLTVAADGSGPVTITGGGNFVVLGAFQVFLNGLSFDGVSLIAASDANVNIQNVSISDGVLTVANNSLAIVGSSSVEAPQGLNALAVLFNSTVNLQGGTTLLGASDAYAAVGLGGNSVLNLISDRNAR